MSNHNLDPKLYDLLVYAKIIDPTKSIPPIGSKSHYEKFNRLVDQYSSIVEEYVISSDSKQIKDQQHEVYTLYELNIFLMGLFVLVAISAIIAMSIGLVYLLT